MSQSEIARFLEQVATHPELAMKFCAAVSGKSAAQISAAIHEFGQGEGFHFTQEELAATTESQRSERLSEQDLDQIAGGSWTDIGGTALGTPAWAAIIGLVDQGRGIAGGFTTGGTDPLFNTNPPGANPPGTEAPSSGAASSPVPDDLQAILASFRSGS